MLCEIVSVYNVQGVCGGGGVCGGVCGGSCIQVTCMNEQKILRKYGSVV